MSLPFRTRLFRWLMALLFLPLVAAAGWSLFDLSGLFLAGREWSHPWFWALGGGLALWLAAFFGLPRPMWVYVFGHELTHALAVYLHGGEVYRFNVTKRGGHVISDKCNWFIALAPYFVPLYTLLWIALWCTVGFYWHGLDRWTWLLYGGIGVTWGFHLTFTVSMIREGQSDLEGQDVFFSLVLIVLLNLLLIEAGLVAAVHGVSFVRFGLMLWHRTTVCYAVTGHALWTGAVAAYQFIARLCRSRAVS